MNKAFGLLIINVCISATLSFYLYLDSTQTVDNVQTEQQTIAAK